MRNSCCHWAKNCQQVRAENGALSKLAEGEELGSNLLQVLHRRPTELGGLGWVAGALPAPSLRIEGRETAILPRRRPLAAKIRAGCATTSKLWPLPRSADRRPLASSKVVLRAFFGVVVGHSPSTILSLPAFVSRIPPDNSCMYLSWISRLYVRLGLPGASNP